MARIRYFYRYYWCAKCMVEIGKLLTEEEYETKKPPTCEKCKNIMERGRGEIKLTRRAPYLGAAASRGLYDIDDTSEQAGDRNVHYSLALTEEAGKLNGKFAHDMKGMIKHAQKQAKAYGWTHRNH